jgi:hypothetical protein
MMRLLRVIGLAAAIGALAAGCSSSSSPSSNSGASNGVAGESASAILTAAVNAVKSAKSVTLNGTIPSGGPAVRVDHGTYFSSGDGKATIVIGGYPLQVVKIGATDYINAPAGFWSSHGVPAADAAKVSGVWVILPDSTVKIGSALTLSALAGHLRTTGKVTKGGTSTVLGQPVIALITPQHDTIYVATAGTPYPVEVVKGSTGHVLTLTSWNQGSEPTPPAGAKTLAQLGLGGPSGSSGTSGT